MVADSIKFSAPGKVILFGEHAVVYGHPAIATAVSSRAYCTVKESDEKNITLSAPLLFPNQIFTISEKISIPQEIDPIKHIILLISKKYQSESLPNIEITSHISPSAGLGSSAATAVSLTASLLEFYGHDYNLDKINEIAFESEKITHGIPSGIDNAISTYGGGLLYEKGVMTPLSPNFASSAFLIVESGVPRNTGAVIERVRKKKDADPTGVQSIFNRIEEITWDAKKHLEFGNMKEIGNLMNENHEQLEKLGVSIPQFNVITDLLDNTDVLGRKITGAGGGGSIIALYDNFEYAVNVGEKLTTQNTLWAYPVRIFQPGVKIEE